MSKLISLILILSAFLFAFSSTAQTVPNLQSIIKQLQEQINLLNQQITDLQSRVQETEKQVEAVKTELKLTKSLRKGESGEEVRQLQEFLKQFSDIYPEGIITGFFGELTERAVKKFQEKQGIESIGIVGPRTIEKLKEFSVSAVPSVPAISAIPASLSLPLQLASPSQPIISPAIPAIPAIPAVPGVSSAIPAIPAVPAQPSSSTSTSTPTPTATPTPASTSTPTPTPSSSPVINQIDFAVISVSVAPSSVAAGNLVTVSATFYNPSNTTQSIQVTIGKGVSSVNDGSKTSTTYYLSLPPGNTTQSQTFTGSYGAISSAPGAPANTYYSEASISGVGNGPIYINPYDPNTANNYLRATSAYTVTSASTLTPTPTPTPAVSSQYTMQGTDGTWCIDGDYGTSAPDGSTGPVYIKSNCQDQTGTYYDYCDSSGNVHDWGCVGMPYEAGRKDVKCSEYSYQVSGSTYGNRGYVCSDGGLIKTALYGPNQISATANVLDTLKSVLQNLNNLLFQLKR